MKTHTRIIAARPTRYLRVHVRLKNECAYATNIYHSLRNWPLYISEFTMELKLTDAGGDTMDLVDISGYRTCSFGRSPETLEKLVHNISQLECREDDIFIFAPVKSGKSHLFLRPYI